MLHDATISAETRSKISSKRTPPIANAQSITVKLFLPNMLTLVDPGCRLAKDIAGNSLVALSTTLSRRRPHSEPYRGLEGRGGENAG
jgi:hypothetical protein